MRLVFLVLLLSGWALAQLPVAATTGPIGSLVQEVGGERVKVAVVVPLGADPHSFEPRPSTLRAVGNAQVLFANGLFLETFLPRLQSQLPRGARVVRLAEGQEGLICGLRSVAAEKASRGIEMHVHGDCDPHLWLDPMFGMAYAEQIQQVLSQLDPTGAAYYAQQTQRLNQKIQQIHQRTQACLANVPRERRKLVVQHESLSYLARRYDLRVVGSIADFAGQERGAQSLVRLAQTMKQEGVGLILTEPQFSEAQARSLAEATGARIGRIYSDALDVRVASYLEMLEFNSRSLCSHLP